MAISLSKIYEKESESAAVLQVSCSLWKAVSLWGVYNEKPRTPKCWPVLDHLLFHSLCSLFTVSPPDDLSSEVQWIKFGFHLHPVTEIMLPSCRREQKWIQCGFPCLSVLQPCFSLLALSEIYFSLCEESVAWLMMLLSITVLMPGPSLITAIR